MQKIKITTYDYIRVKKDKIVFNILFTEEADLNDNSCKLIRKNLIKRVNIFINNLIEKGLTKENLTICPIEIRQKQVLNEIKSLSKTTKEYKQSGWYGNCIVKIELPVLFEIPFNFIWDICNNFATPPLVSYYFKISDELYEASKSKIREKLYKKCYDQTKEIVGDHDLESNYIWYNCDLNNTMINNEDRFYKTRAATSLSPSKPNMSSDDLNEIIDKDMVPEIEIKYRITIEWKF